MKDLNEIIERNVANFTARKQNCAESVLLIMSEYWGLDSDALPRIATPFGGGMSGRQTVCGAITGGMMAIGLLMGREVGGDQLPARKCAKAYIDWFEQKYGCINCRELIDIDLTVPGNNEIFRAPGGKHDTVCLKLVREVCAHLAENVPAK